MSLSHHLMSALLLLSHVALSVQDNGRHVCTQEKELAIPVPVRQSYTRGIYNAELNTITYQTAYRTVVKVQLKSQKTNGCCPGWEKSSPHEQGCSKPICQDGCENGGQCISPNVCMCGDGYTGYRCQIEINECEARHKCQQICINTPGSYECACREGFKVSEDGFGCELCLSCTKEFQDIMYQMDSVAEVRQEIDDIQDMKNRALKFEEFQKDVIELRDLKVQMKNLKENRAIEQSIDNIKIEMSTLKEDQESDTAAMSELKNQLKELQEVKHELTTLRELKKQVNDLQELKLQVKALQELKSELKTLLEMKVLADTIPEIHKDIEELFLLANTTSKLTMIRSQLDKLTRDKADVVQVRAVNQSLQILRPVLEEIPRLKTQVDRVMEMTSESGDGEDLRKQLIEMTSRVKQLEDDKKVLQSNLTLIMTNYESSVNAFQHREQTTQDLMTSTSPYDMFETDMPLDRLASLSQQISILEEKMAQCSCDDYSRG
ncbi:myosin-3-like isoform X2 [Biomphalaria glabrata]|uniref:Myosin-3-like isoform X2 n=1 Tax=Biomphalaria glabrata TaxID=6526 RepID=A0A9W3B9Q4_BIOGL|nr:myosin-3-like isoform X2 [Biomphalaria glabrata]